MSDFAIRLYVVSRIDNHENADNLEIISLENLAYPVVGRKGDYQLGDKVFYFPLDSVLPEALKSHLGVDIGQYVKTKKLRGVYSQGFIITLASGLNYHADIAAAYQQGISDYKDLFGVEKYERYGEFVSGKTRKLLVSRYEIQNAEVFPHVLQNLLNVDCVVMEKVEGANWALSLDTKGNLWSSQRSFSHADQTSSYYQAALALNLPDKLLAIKAQYADLVGDNLFSLRGELVGESVQGNYYKLKGHRIYIFDALLNHAQYFDFELLEKIALEFELPLVPLLYKGKLADYLTEASLDKLSHGKSLINPERLREGIVLRPLREIYDVNFGRVQIKQRDRAYLEKYS